MERSGSFVDKMWFEYSDEWEAMKFYRRGKMHAMKRQSVEEDGLPCQSSPCHTDALLIVKR